MCPASFCCHLHDDHHLGARSPDAVTTHLVGQPSLCCQRMSPLRTLDDHISNCHNLACVGYVHQVSVVSFSVTHKLSFHFLGSSLLKSLFRFRMKIVQPKIDNLLIESLGFKPRISSSRYFSSPPLTSKFLILFAWRIATLYIILLGKTRVNEQASCISSSFLLRLSANSFCCGVSGTVFSCRLPASKQHILNCSERKSFALSSLSFLGVCTLRTNFFRLASASFFALRKSTNKNFVFWSAKTMQNQNPDSDSTLKGPITTVNNLPSFSSNWVSATLDIGVFVILSSDEEAIRIISILDLQLSVSLT